MVTKAAGFVVFRRMKDAIQYLLLQASYGDYHWSPPKGHVDPNEDEFATALRETLEETGLSEKDLRIYKNMSKTLQYEVKGKPKTVVYWVAELVNTEKSIVLSDEHQSFKWLGLREACDIGRYSDMRQLLEYCDMSINK